VLLLCEKGAGMAKNDYDYIVFRVLTYLYGCLKRQIVFDEAAFKELIITKNVPEEYFTDVLRMMQGEGLIEGAIFTKAWGHTYIMASSLSDLSITAEGVRYVLNNDVMKQIKKAAIENAGAICELVKLVLSL
jgi:hypothetical protein